MKPKFNPDSATHPGNADVTEKVIVRGIHLEITPALRDHALGVAERLLRHSDHLVRVRIDLEHDHTRGVGDQFAAKGHIEIGGPDLIASVRSDDAYKSLDLLSDRLDRMLRERSRTRADRRNHGRASEKFRKELAVED
jgi:putative sigma-54 modulation protein